MKFNELVRLLEDNGFKLVKQKASIRYYGKRGWDRLIRLDYHGAKEVPTGIYVPCYPEAAGIQKDATFSPPPRPRIATIFSDDEEEEEEDEDEEEGELNTVLLQHWS